MHLVEEIYIDKDLPNGWKPYYIYAIIVDDTLVGKVTLRCGSSEEHDIDGHVGYTIDPPYRGHHYAYQAMLLIKEIAKEKGYLELIITCNPDNIASKKTILKLNATYIETKKIPTSMKKYFDQEEIEKQIYVLKL